MRFPIALALITAAGIVHAQPVAREQYQDLQWRMIGPFRGGRTVGAAGIPGHPNEFIMGVNNGGVWKTTDYGQTWQPIFDSADTGSVGALAVAPSAPDTIYVGSGEGLQRPDLSTGDGMYKTTDGGKTWTHLGLEDGQQIGSIIVDPHDSNRVFVAVLGHPFGPNEERGVFRSTDGGATWQKVLYKDADTGAVALAFDPSNPQTVYADLWAARGAPWENGYWEGPESGLFKSTDGGDTWTKLTSGLPTAKEGLGRIGFSISASDPNLIYAYVSADKDGGIYKSEDSGASWKLINNEGRLWGRPGDFNEIRVDPKDPKVVYIANTSTYKSTDGGKNFFSWKGAPGGDDYHTVWISPDDSKLIMLASDQGATISVNGGDTWSSWYNQPTAQFYHVITDNQFPYWVYGGQQESGSAAICSRGNDGQITFREWHPVGAEEYGYIAPDPLNSNIIYGGKVSKFDRVTGQVQDVAPAGSYRTLRTAPLVFSPVDPHVLFYAGNMMFKTTDGARSWSVISPDLTREHPEVPDFLKKDWPTVERRGVIYAIGPSYRDVNVIWAGTDDGLVHVTRDGGKTWQNVTPKELTSWDKVSIIDAGHFDADTAYVAVNALRKDDLKPHIFKTHDGGQTWEQIVNGLPSNAPIDVVREDPVRKGLLFCGSETAVYFSIDDGANWNPLRLNMAASSVRDLVVHGDDLVAGTHGRGFWILDDITHLRQLGVSGTALYQPEIAYRYRRDTNSDTPLPPEIPAGKNPPDGAVIDYYLDAVQPSVQIQIVDASGNVVRTYSSSDSPPKFTEHDLDVPMYWVRPFTTPATTKGHHRFVWDLFWQPNGFVPYFPISAIYHDTPAVPTSFLAGPGQYTVRLIVGGQTYSQRLELRMDPRIKASPDAIRKQTNMALDCYRMALDLQKRAAAAGETNAPRRRFGRQRGAGDTFSSLAQSFSGLMGEIDGADAAPTSMMENEYRELKEKAEKLERSK